jgi:hypothetical protein
MAYCKCHCFLPGCRCLYLFSRGQSVRDLYDQTAFKAFRAFLALIFSVAYVLSVLPRVSTPPASKIIMCDSYLVV